LTDIDSREFESFSAKLQIPKLPEVNIKVGDTIGRFKVNAWLGKGGSSIVYDCVDEQLQRRVAVKILNPKFFDDSSLTRLEREARTLAKLDHPSIVKAYEIRPYRIPPYIVMELVPGGPSGRLVRNGPLPPILAARLICDVARAVQHAHDQGVLHRDIKPSNLLVVQPFDMDGPLPAKINLKISDFGLARPIAGDSRLTSTNAIIGTPAYMSPEQSRGNQKEVGPPSDIYSLGVVLYEFLIGRPPLVADNVMQTLQMVNDVDPVPPRHIQPVIARDLDTICMKCLRKDPAKRYATATDLADDLERFLDGRPILARPLGPVGRLYRWCKRNSRLAAALVGIIMLLCSLVTLGIQYVILQKNLLRQAEASANREREAAQIARFESDSYRIILFFGVSQLSKISPQIAKIQTETEARQLSENAMAANRRIIDMYLKRHNFKKVISGELIDVYFRDALALRDVGFIDDSITLLEWLMAQARQSKPGDADYLQMISIGNRCAPVLGRLKIDQQKQHESCAIMLKARDEFSFDPDQPGVEPIHWLERYGLLTTLLKALEEQNPKAETSQIRAELETISHKLAQTSLNPRPAPPAPKQ
jgi:serine/threonine protein kinase